MSDATGDVGIAPLVGSLAGRSLTPIERLERAKREARDAEDALERAFVQARDWHASVHGKQVRAAADRAGVESGKAFALLAWAQLLGVEVKP